MFFLTQHLYYIILKHSVSFIALKSILNKFALKHYKRC